MIRRSALALVTGGDLEEAEQAELRAGASSGVAVFAPRTATM
jgi:hypothetical protein